MKKLLIILAVCGICFAIESPVGSSRMPVSSVRSGLRRSPNPINLNGNDVVTGNVGGGKEFRGFVPYRSETNIGSSVATDSFNQFMRRSAPVNLGVRQSYLPQPYYIPSRTTSSMQRGTTPGLITYASVRTTGGTGDFAVPIYAKPISGSKDLSQATPQYQYTLSRPLSYTNPADLEKIVSYGLAGQQEQKELIQALKRIKTRDDTRDAVKTDGKEDAKSQDGIQTVPQRIEPAQRSFEPAEPAKRGQMPDEISLANKNKSVYEQMLEESSKPFRQPEEVKEAEESDETEESKEESEKIEISKIDQETADALRGIHKTFATKANTKFNYYMSTAEEYLKDGLYYRAADAYTLASIYNPSDPLAYAGRSHALFASGEYMSSAYYLMRAVKIFPGYVEVKVDIHAMIPDKDRLESRIADITKWIDKTKSPELEFLIAYLYNQLDKPEQALNMITAAYADMPDNQAIKILKQAIENK